MNFAAAFEVVLHAEPIFQIGGFTITNSMLLGWIVSVFIITVFVLAARHISLKAGGKLSQVFELPIEMITNLAADVMHDRKRAAKYAPFLASLFIFIMLNNWFGLLPGVGSVKIGGVPLFRAWTSDLTGTLALSITSIVLVQLYAIKELGVKGHLTHYFSKQPWNPINLFVGLLEVLGEFTRMASLALRLFGNIFAGEVLLIVLSAITAYGAPVATLPFIFMEFFVGFIQAFVFTMLVIVYLSLATTHHDDAHDIDESDHSPEAKLAAKGSPSRG